MYFEGLFTTSDNERLLAPLIIDKFKEAISGMHTDKSPSPDGLNPAFSLEVNDTNLVLIPKCNSPKEMKDLHPISLCNIVHKIFAKMLANRLKTILPQLVSESQSVLVLGRSIIENVLVALELLHYMKRKVNCKKGDVSL